MFTKHLVESILGGQSVSLWIIGESGDILARTTADRDNIVDGDDDGDSSVLKIRFEAVECERQHLDAVVWRNDHRIWGVINPNADVVVRGDGADMDINFPFELRPK